MRNIKTIFILVLSLILFAVSCSNEGTTGGETDNTETTETIDAKDFPKGLEGTYQDEKVVSIGRTGILFDTKVSYYETTKTTKIEGAWLKDGVTPPDTYRGSASIEKWKQTKKGGNPIKLEGEYYSEPNKEKYTIIYDYASETLIGTCVHPDVTALFNGKQISKQP